MRFHHNFRFIALFSVLLVLSCGKQDDSLTREEARTALDESVTSTQASSLTCGLVEISTHFTIGDGVTAALEELRNFIESQIPCSSVTVGESTLTVNFGTLNDNCTYHVQTYAGEWRLTVIKNAPGEVEVHHAY